jgi:hypothetical protein
MSTLNDYNHELKSSYIEGLFGISGDNQSISVIILASLITGNDLN